MPQESHTESTHRAEGAEERGEGICRTCLAPIWNEGGTIGRRQRPEGWSDRIERGGDSLVCFKAIDYRHVPLSGREAAIYDYAYDLGTRRGRRGVSADELLDKIDAWAFEETDFTDAASFDYREGWRDACDSVRGLIRGNREPGGPEGDAS